MEAQLLAFIRAHYLQAGALALLGVYGALFAYSHSGRMKLVRWASLQYVVIVAMVLLTPWVLGLLTSKPN